MYEYNDGLCPGSRRPRLYLAKGGQAVKFTGENVPGYLAVATARYEKSGKWSNTTYRLELAPGVRPLHFLSPLHGLWGDDLLSWGAVCEELGLPLEEAQRIVRAEYPRTGERLDKLEEFALANEQAGAVETEVVVVSFGSPTNRAAREGYWEQPKHARTSTGVDVEIRPGSMTAEEAQARAEKWGLACGYEASDEKVAAFRDKLVSEIGWDHPQVVAPAGAKVLSVKHRPGMHGGTYAVEVVVPV